MRHLRRTIWIVTVVVMVTIMHRGQLLGQVTSDQAVAIINYPYISVDSAHGIDTTVQLSNAATDDGTYVRCFYENANGHCDTSSSVICSSSGDCPIGEACVPRWRSAEFSLRLTTRQPLGWRASQGLSTLPCDSISCPQANEGAIPPVDEDPFTGSLLCFTADGLSGNPIDRNALTGEATIEHYDAGQSILDVAKYNAVGIQAIPGANNGDQSLMLGGPDAEYNGCPNVNILSHFFDGALEPAAQSSNVYTKLVLVPCNQDPLVDLRPGSSVVQFLVFNEFEQRFSASRRVDCQFVSRLSNIDTANSARSLFNVAVSGTLTGQTRMRPIGSGVFAVAIEEHVDSGGRIMSAGFNTHEQGARSGADVIGYRPPVCGNGVLESGEQCDDGNTLDGDCCSASCQLDLAGQVCADDSNACTTDQCDGQGTCVHTVADPLPAECGCCSFSAGGGRPPCPGDCDNDVAVTTAEVQICQDIALGYRPLTQCQLCDINSDAIVSADEVNVANTNRLNGCPSSDSVCEPSRVDRVYCEQVLGGFFSASAACTPFGLCGTPFCASDADCNDGSACTSDRCDPTNPSANPLGCMHTQVVCADDGNVCNGPEACDSALGCVSGPPAAVNAPCDLGGNPCTTGQCDGTDTCVFVANASAGTPCNDSLYCNGTESCDGSGLCVGNNDPPCAGTQCNTCQETTDTCVDPAGTACNDTDAGTVNDACDGQGACVGTVVTGNYAILRWPSSPSMEVHARLGWQGLVNGHVCSDTILVRPYTHIDGDAVALKTAGTALTFMKGSEVTGDLVTQGGSISGLLNVTHPRPPIIDPSGTVQPLVECGAAGARANQRRAEWAALTPDLDVGTVVVPSDQMTSIPSSGSFGAGQTVVHANDILVGKNGTLKLVGSATTQQVIVHVSGPMKVRYRGKVILQGLTPEQVIFVVDGPITLLQFTSIGGSLFGGNAIRLGWHSTVDGQVLGDMEIVLRQFVTLNRHAFAGW